MRHLIYKYKKILKFTSSSIISALLDLFVFTLIIYFFGNTYIATLVATLVARISSSCLNFILNKKFSFKSDGPLSFEAIGYFTLFFVKILLSSFFVYILSQYINISETLIKAFVDIGLFFFSYLIQDKIIFRKRSNYNKE